MCAWTPRGMVSFGRVQRLDKNPEEDGQTTPRVWSAAH